MNFYRAKNESILSYMPGSPEKLALKKALADVDREVVEIPCVIGGKEVRTGNIFEVRMPHDHRHVIARVHLAGPQEIASAATAALAAKKEWESLPWQHRARIFLKAAELLSGPWRPILNASTMAGQSKNVFQAEIDSACEFADFLRFNVQFYEDLQNDQPLNADGVLNTLEYRALEGFVLAITPFNFTAIGANLPSAPALIGNTVVWKPTESQSLSAYRTFQLFQAAGLPDGVINFIPAHGPTVSDVLLKHPELAGIHFTGSTQVFDTLIQRVGENTPYYKTYPKIVGETGGKDFILCHPSADLDVSITALVRGAFEYQGQKCSAASRAYIPESLWRRMKDPLIETTRAIKMGDVRDFSVFMGAVIDERSFTRLDRVLSEAKNDAKNDARIQVLQGAKTDKTQGWFVEPTLLKTNDPKSPTMVTELFGPVLTLYVYPDAQYAETLNLVDQTSSYSLTGAILSQDRAAIHQAMSALRHAAGNIYINDKCTGAVVGQQPFGGARRSGTNDKAGSMMNLLRWVSPRTVKETLNPPKSPWYPYMMEP